MNPRNLIILVVLGIIAIAGGWYFGVAMMPTEQRSADAGKLMFPDLAAGLQQAKQVDVVHQGKALVIEKRDIGGRIIWGLQDRGGYPVQETKLRGMFTALTELRLVDQRTANPSEYDALGVGDPNAPAADTNLLRVLDGSGKTIAAVIVGRRRAHNSGNAPDEVYVRRPGDKQSWLAQGSLEVDSDPQLWLDRTIMNIDHSRIDKVQVKRGNQTLNFARTGDKLALTTPADHPILDNFKLEDVSRALELLTFEDVHQDTASPGEQIGQAVFSTSDGLTVTAQVYRMPPNPTTKLAASQDVLARFDATGQDKAKPEATRLHARLAGWTYELGAWKQQSLVPALDDLKAAPPAAPAAGATKP
jgi:hypothetical protein